MRMDRLTFEGNFCDIAQCHELPCPYDNNCMQKQVWERLRAYEDTRLSPEGLKQAGEIEEYLNECGSSIARVAELIKADDERRIVVLPCKVGDTVYLLRGKKVAECYAYRIQVTKGCLDVYAKNDDIDGTPRTALELGKTVFLSREEAEKALEARENGN